MNFRRNHRFGVGLRVEQVIVPRNENQRDVASSGNYEARSESTQSSTKVKENKLHEFCGLVVLSKPPLEDFVQGTRRKKCTRKKKPKCLLRNDLLSCHSFSQTNEMPESKDQSVADLPHTPNFIEDKILERNIKRKIQFYENKVKEIEVNNCRRQRHLEHQSTDELENLVETWSALIKRRKEQIEKGIPSCSSRYHAVRHCFRPVDISLISKKYWKDQTDEKLTKRTIESEEDRTQNAHQPEGLEQLEDEFIEKLVFVDDSDDDLS